MDDKSTWMDSSAIVAALREHRNNDVQMYVLGTLVPVGRVYYDATADRIVIEPAGSEALKTAYTTFDPWMDDLGGHQYMSTACLHASYEPGRKELHDHCDGTVGTCGEKHPGRCKWCPAKCQCDHHRAPS